MYIAQSIQHVVVGENENVALAKAAHHFPHELFVVVEELPQHLHMIGFDGDVYFYALPENEDEAFQPMDGWGIYSPDGENFYYVEDAASARFLHGEQYGRVLLTSVFKEYSLHDFFGYAYEGDESFPLCFIDVLREKRIEREYHFFNVQDEFELMRKRVAE